MSKASWIHTGGGWKQATKVWQKVSGVWVYNVIPWVKEDGVWYDCMPAPTVGITLSLTTSGLITSATAGLEWTDPNQWSITYLTVYIDGVEYFDNINISYTMYNALGVEVYGEEIAGSTTDRDFSGTTITPSSGYSMVFNVTD